MRVSNLVRISSFLLISGLIVAPTLLAAQEKIKVVASFSILGDMIRQVTGDLAEVTTIVGPDADAHVYTPSTADAKSVAHAEIIFVNGLGFETWSQTLVETSNTKAEVFIATNGIKPLMVDGQIDPHAWNSLKNGMQYVANIADAMAQIDTVNAEAYKSNARTYTVRLEKLHKKALESHAKLRADQCVVVTSHDAFGYLEEDYGFTFLAPLGIDTDAEPSARDLAKLIDHLKSVGAAALFVENITNPSLVHQIARETGIQVGGRLFSDALSERGGPATSYEEMFKHNLETLITALSRNL